MEAEVYQLFVLEGWCMHAVQQEIFQVENFTYSQKRPPAVAQIYIFTSSTYSVLSTNTQTSRMAAGAEH